ncbi:MAG: OmpA family protein [Saprospiraceae bacterium]|nr:OmpA family protein [Saprospiraceae bacterium]
MSSRILVLAVFVVYSLVCWNRYVCGIKQVCGPMAEAGAQPIAETPTIEPDTFESTAPSQPTFTTPSNPPSTPPPSNTNAEPDLDKVQVEELEDRVVIHFPYNSTRKEDDAAIDEYLSRLARQLVDHGGSVSLTGHTDNVGDPKTNEKFALRRAKNIRDILINKGVNRKQISTHSYGERKPLATNDNPRGRYKNRRVEIRVKQ